MSRSRSDADLRSPVPPLAEGRGPADPVTQAGKTGKTLNSPRNRSFQYSDQVAEAIDEIDHLIGAGKFVAGQRLVEADLAAQLGIGRVPVREALRILAGDGVIELMPNRGARVRAYTGRHIAEMLRALTALLCLGIEEFIAAPEYAAGMERLIELDREITRCIGEVDIYGFFEASGRYQQTIFESAGNSYLIELHRRAHFHHYSRQLLDTIGFGRLARMGEAYAGMTQAMLARDDARAGAFIRDSLPPAVELLLQSDQKAPSATRPRAR